MTARALARKVIRLEALARARGREQRPLLERLAADPAQSMALAGLPPDSWQRDLLRSSDAQVLLLCSRQAGKSQKAEALALHAALTVPRAPVLLLSPSLRQLAELFRKVVDLYGALGRPLPATAESALRLELANGSRVVSLPGDEGTVRGFSGVALLVIDEAARVPDPLYLAVRPMLAVSRGRLVALSTPYGKRGWFHDEWHGQGGWRRVRVTAEECPRITAEFLAEERRAMGERWYRQEYLTSFEDCVDAVFSYHDIQAALSPDVQPLFAR